MAKRDPKTGKFVKPEVKARATTKARVTLKPKIVKEVKPKGKTVTKPKATEAVKPKSKQDYGKCTSCGSSLERLLRDSGAEKPKHTIVCDNPACNQYRYVVA